MTTNYAMPENWPLIQVGEVAVDFWHCGQEMQDVRDHKWVPPFERYGMRYRIPRRSYSSEYGWTNIESAGHDIVGFFRAGRPLRSGELQDDVVEMYRDFVDEAKWTVTAAMFMLDKKGREVFSTTWHYLLRENGEIITGDNRVAFFSMDNNRGGLGGCVPVRVRICALCTQL